MESFSYKVLQLSEMGSFMLSWGVLFASAAISVNFINSDFKMRRPMYFLATGTAFLFFGITSFLVIGVHDAIKNDYLSLLVATTYGSLIPIGAFLGICAVARSLDAYGVRGKWVFCFIPLANLILLFSPSLDVLLKSSFSRSIKNVAIITLGIIMAVLGNGLSRVAERKATTLAKLAENDWVLQQKALRLEVQNTCLEGLLKKTAKAIPVPTKIDTVTTLKAVDVDNAVLSYVYEISNRDAVFSQNWRDLMTSQWCKSPNFKQLIDIGASVEGKYLSQDGKPLAELRVNTLLCHQWTSLLDKKMQQAVDNVRGPKKLDEITTLLRGEYKDEIFSYYYTLSAAPSDIDWKDNLKFRWCKSENFGPMMVLGISIRGIYSTENNNPIAEVTVNSTVCEQVP
jgi:hypothetical protein